MINIYVGNLPYSVKSRELREAFEPYGEVVSAEVIFDRRTKRSRGYGFVEMEDEGAGRRAIEALNGVDFKGRELRVDESQPKEKKEKEKEREQAQEPAGGARAPRAERPRAAAPAAPERAAESPGGLRGLIRRLFG